jgi:hypothetical protein
MKNLLTKPVDGISLSNHNVPTWVALEKQLLNRLYFISRVKCVKSAGGDLPSLTTYLDRLRILGRSA